MIVHIVNDSRSIAALLLLFAMPQLARAQQEEPMGRDDAEARAVSLSPDDQRRDARQSLVNLRPFEAVEKARRIESRHDDPRTTAILAEGYLGIGLLKPGSDGMTDAAMMADVCLSQLKVWQPPAQPQDLEDSVRALRITCTAVGAEAYLQLGNFERARQHAQQCVALDSRSGDSTALPYTVYKYFRICEQVLRDTEAEGRGIMGGDGKGYGIVSGSLGYTFRYISKSLSAGGARPDGLATVLAAGYPSSRAGPVLLRPELYFRTESLSDNSIVYRGEFISSSALVLGGGLRLVLTYPATAVTFEFSVGAGPAFLFSSRMFLAKDTTLDRSPVQQVAGNKGEGWCPGGEGELLAKAYFREFRGDSIAVAVGIEFGMSFTFGWKFQPKDPPPVMDDLSDFGSLAFRWGIALRMRLAGRGHVLSPY